MQSSPPSARSTDSPGSRPPGTPQLPIEPPRRRSSLFFSKVLQEASSPKTPAQKSAESDESHQPSERLNPTSNIGRKRLASPRAKSITRPGHVAQMQRLFQSAKASLRLDARFAASPAGSIDSRLPPSPGEDGHHTDAVHFEKPAPGTPARDWRYSTAPHLIAGFDVDVREPFPQGGSPRLPALPSAETGHDEIVVMEPPSSGFNSPAEGTSVPLSKALQPIEYPTLPPLDDTSDEQACSSRSRYLSSGDLEQSLTRLRLNSDQEMDVDAADDSPIINHLKRKSADASVDARTIDEAEKAIVLSPFANAAARSAKIRRGILSDLFAGSPAHMESDGGNSSPKSSSSAKSGTACPDPLLHMRTPMVLCPDPALHFTPSEPPHPQTTANSSAHSRRDRQHVQQVGTPYPPMPFNRTTATGSPMPILKAKSPPISSGMVRRPFDDSAHSSRCRHPSQNQHRQGGQPGQRYGSGTTEHFRPGWYYARESPQFSSRPDRAMYSFTTAAAKVVGRDTAPDSRIRDSYRTDTLTPLARPPSRFRKHGVAALANARGVNKYYGRSQGARQPSRQEHASGTSFPDGMRFRSSPPRSLACSRQTPPLIKRSRDVGAPTMEVMEDARAQEQSLDPNLKLEAGEDIIEVDEETRAAVRMSIYGAGAPELTSDIGLRELSPNVTQWRKGNRPSSSRKKRRPSYWDIDLEEVVRSPAARHVVSSPIKKDDIRSHKGEVEYEEENLPPDAMSFEGQNHNQVIEDGSAPQEVDMED